MRFSAYKWLKYNTINHQGSSILPCDFRILVFSWPISVFDDAAYDVTPYVYMRNWHGKVESVRDKTRYCFFTPTYEPED